MEPAEAFNLLKKYLIDDKLQKHCLAVAFIMERLAEHFNEDKEKWYLTGLLHDIDYEQTKQDPHQHSKLGAEILKKHNLPEEIVRAVLVHNDIHGLAAETRMEKALIASDALSGLIIASVLVLPDKKIANLKPESVLKRFREKAFARGANREEIASCQKFGLSLEEFINLGVEALKKNSSFLGL